MNLIPKTDFMGMKKFLTWFLVCLAIVWAVSCTGTASYGTDSTGFNPVSVEASAQSGGVPVGMVVVWPVATNPADTESWLECNGQSTAGYPELAAVVGANIPDLRGKFLRGLGGNSAELGLTQGDAIRNITGTLSAYHQAQYQIRSSGAFGHTYLNYGESGSSRSHPETALYHFDASRQVPTANENRPINTAVRYLIRAKP